MILCLIRDKLIVEMAARIPKMQKLRNGVNKRKRIFFLTNHRMHLLVPTIIKTNDCSKLELRV